MLLSLWTVCLQAAVVGSNWVGGEFGNWKDAANWDPPLVPDNNESLTFNVTIDSNSIDVNEVFVVCVQSRTINKLDCYGVVVPDVWTEEPVSLTVTNGITNYGRFEPDDFHFNADFTNVTGASALLDEITFLQGNIINQSGAEIEIEVTLEVDHNILNAGTITFLPNSVLTEPQLIQNTGTILLNQSVCQIDGILDNQAPGIIKGSGLVEAEDSLLNEGQIIASAGTLKLTSPEPFISDAGSLLRNQPLSTLHIEPAQDVNNYGSLEICSGGIAFDCNLNNDPNSTIKLLSGTLAATSITQRPNANFTGFGSITGNLFIDPNATIKLTGPTSIVGDVTIDPNATLEISDATTLIIGHTTCNNGKIHIKGGSIIPQGGFTNNTCNIVWELPVYTNVADFNLDGLVNFHDFAYFTDTWLWQSAWH
jgi:hypothetical protein